MLANVKRSHYESWLSGTYYVVEAELELTPEEQDLVDKHSLADKVIFDSADADHYANATIESAQNTFTYHKPFGEPFFDIMASFYAGLWNAGVTAVNAAMWTFSLRITVQSLLDGTYFESDKFDEVAQAEMLIRQAIKSLQDDLLYLQTFTGQDNLIEPE